MKRQIKIWREDKNILGGDVLSQRKGGEEISSRSFQLYGVVNELGRVFVNVCVG